MKINYDRLLVITLFVIVAISIATAALNVESEGNMNITGNLTVGTDDTAKNIQIAVQTDSSYKPEIKLRQNGEDKLRIYYSETSESGVNGLDSIVFRTPSNLSIKSDEYFNLRSGDDTKGFAVRNAAGLKNWLALSNIGGSDIAKFDVLEVSPASAAGSDLGSAARYWDEINYKTLTDRGCLGSFASGVEMQDGKVVTATEALKQVNTEPTEKTVYGAPKLDYSSMPKVVYVPAPICEANKCPKEWDIDGNVILWYAKGEKMGEDGAETTALISILIQSIKEMDARINYLESLQAK